MPHFAHAARPTDDDRPSRETRRRNAGQGLTELLLMMPFAVVLALGAAEFGRIQVWRLSLAQSAHAAALYASQDAGSAQNTDAITQKVVADIRGCGNGNGRGDGNSNGNGNGNGNGNSSSSGSSGNGNGNGNGHNAGDPQVQVTLNDPKNGGTGDGYGKQTVHVRVDLQLPALLSLPGFPTTWNLRADAEARVLNREFNS